MLNSIGCNLLSITSLTGVDRNLLHMLSAKLICVIVFPWEFELMMPCFGRQSRDGHNLQFNQC